MEGEIFRGLILAHVPGQDLPVSLSEVHKDECVEHIAEARVHVEIQNLPTQFEIVLDKDGNAGAVRFNVGAGSADSLRLRVCGSYI